VPRRTIRMAMIVLAQLAADVEAKNVNAATVLA